MAYEVTYHDVGEDAGDMCPGDFLLTHGTHRNARMIQFGQSIELGDVPATKVNHAVLCLGGNDAAESLANGVQFTTISSWRHTRYAIVRTYLNKQDQCQVIDYATSVLSQKYRYGWIQMASIVLRMVTGMKFFFGRSESEICSGFVAGALTRGGYVWPYPPSFMTPADLGSQFNVDLPWLGEKS